MAKDWPNQVRLALEHLTSAYSIVQSLAALPDNASRWPETPEGAEQAFHRLTELLALFQASLHLTVAPSQHDQLDDVETLGAVMIHLPMLQSLLEQIYKARILLAADENNAALITRDREQLLAALHRGAH